MKERILEILKKMAQNDKLLHFGVGFILGMVCVVFAIIAGFVKEQVDEKDGGKFDIYDMLATWIGGALGQCVSLWLIDTFIR